MPQSSAYKERVQQEVLGTKKVLRDFGIEKIKSDADLFKALRALRDAGRLDELKALLHARREAITTALGKTIILGGRDGKSRYFEEFWIQRGANACQRLRGSLEIRHHFSRK